MKLTGVSLAEIALYASYWIVAVIVPGMLVHRAIRGPRSTLTEDVGFGAATGLALELSIAQILSLVGQEQFVRWWWVAIYLGFIMIPRMRNSVGPIRYSERTSFLWSLSLSMVLISLLIYVTFEFTQSALPPQDSSVYQDLWWHLSLSQELLKPGPPQIPQVTGEPLIYHYFANLHIATASATSTVAPEVVLLRLWSVPVIGSTAVVVAGLAQQVARVTWAGPLAAWLSLSAGMGGFVWLGQAGPASYSTQLGSPSQVLINLLFVAAASFFVDLVRGPITGSQWLWGALLAYACSGAKPTGLPLLVAGTVLAGLARIVSAKKVPWALVAATCGMMLLVFLSLATTTGSTTSNITVAGSLRGFSAYRQLVGDNEPAGSSTGLLLDSLSSPYAWIVAAAILLWIVGGNAFRLVGLLALFHPATRRDGAIWWLAGASVAGWSAYMILDHASLSQRYFLVTASFPGAVLTAAFAGAVVTQRPGSSRWLLGSLVVGAVVAWAAGGAISAVAVQALEVGDLDPLKLPATALFCAIVLIALASTLARRKSSISAGIVLVLIMGLTIGMTIPGYVIVAGRQLSSVLRVSAQPDPAAPSFVSSGEQSAALWLRRQSDSGEILATNLHCIPPLFEQGCDARAFWLSALSGRRVVLEGWAYTPSDAPGYRRASPWPERLKASNAVFSEPNQTLVQSLRSDFSVDWLVGVYRAGEVSVDLDRHAERVFDNGEVAIFRLADP